MDVKKRSRAKLSSAWVGPWLRQKRRDQNPRPRLEDIGARLGMGRSKMSRLEVGHVPIDADGLPAILRAYDLTVSQLAEFGDELKRRAAS